MARNSQEGIRRKLDRLAAAALVGVFTVSLINDRAKSETRAEAVSSSSAVEKYINATQINELGHKMLSDLQPYQVVDAEWAYEKAREKGGSVFLGEQISVEDSMRINYAAGFRGDDLIRKTAIDGKESDYYPGAIGDVNWNAGGDRSIGMSQIYCSPNSDIGCEGVRDWKDNFDPLTNAQHAYYLYAEAWGMWGYEERFRPWQNNQAGIDARMDRATEAYALLKELYGSLD